MHQLFNQEAAVSCQMGVAKEISVLRINGEKIPVEVSISQIEVQEKEKGKKLFTVVLRDITERRQVQDAPEKEQQFVSNVLEPAGVPT